MLIKDWMTTELITCSPETSLMEAAKLMKDNDVGRLPVLNKSGLVVGIVSDRDVKEASPSKATSLEIHEIYHLLSELRVKDIMTKEPHTVTANETVERVALLMRDNNVGGIPVVDDDGRAVGIITDHDVFRVLINITGVEHGGVQFALELPNNPGSLKQVLDDLRAMDARIVTILTSYDEADASVRRIYIRITPMDRFQENNIINELKEKHKMLYWARDNVHTIIHG